MRIVTSLAFVGLVSLALAGGIAAALRLTQTRLRSPVALHLPATTSIDAMLTYPSQPAGPSASLFRGDNSQADVLELPKASADFMGYWGGYTHSSIQSFSPDLIGTSPDRVSVVFGRRDETVFMSSELYSSPTQKIVHRPKVTISSPWLAIVKYESADNDLYYTCTHRFQLRRTSIISYESKTDVYSLNSHRLMAIVTQRATLKRLWTTRDQLEFARPSRLQVPRADISASANLAPY
jgi:hypothetical protein